MYMMKRQARIANDLVREVLVTGYTGRKQGTRTWSGCQRPVRLVRCPPGWTIGLVLNPVCIRMRR